MGTKVEIEYGYIITEEGKKPRDEAGIVTYIKPDDLDEARQRFGEKVVLQFFWFGVVHAIKNICRVSAKAGVPVEKIQATIDLYTPGSSLRKEKTKKRIKEELERLQAELEKL